MRDNRDWGCRYRLCSNRISRLERRQLDTEDSCNLVHCSKNLDPFCEGFSMSVSSWIVGGRKMWAMSSTWFLYQKSRRNATWPRWLNSKEPGKIPQETVTLRTYSLIQTFFSHSFEFMRSARFRLGKTLHVEVNGTPAANDISCFLTRRCCCCQDGATYKKNEMIT